MSYDLCKDIDWMRLLDGASKFELFDLLTGIKTCLIDKQKDWIQQNILTVHKLACIHNLVKQTSGLLQSNSRLTPRNRS